MAFRAIPVGVYAIGALSIGALALGVIAIGRRAIRRLFACNVRIDTHQSTD
jgi:hypothetical protein